MINTITFDSQMAMAGALTSILSGKSSVNESAKQTKTEKKLVVESDQNGAATASATSTVADNKPESAPEKTVKVEKVCESDTAKARLEKFRAEHKAKKFGKKLKTCCESKKVCEGEEEDKKKKQTGAPVEVPQPEEPDVNAGVEAAPAPAAGGVAEAEGEDNAATGSEEDAGAPAEGGEEEVNPEETKADNKELVAHASAVSERMASLKEKLVQELDADDGLKLGNKEGEETGDADANQEAGDVATVDGADVDK